MYLELLLLEQDLNNRLTPSSVEYVDYNVTPDHRYNFSCEFSFTVSVTAIFHQIGGEPVRENTNRSKVSSKKN